MQKIINGVALLSGLVSLSIVGGGAYLYTQKDALIESATAAATKAATEAAVTYNAQGFSNSSPFKHKNGTSFNSDGRDYQGYNEAGYNSEGYSSSTPPIYNPDYDVSPA